MSLAALAVMAGHAFPIFLKFQGGKAVASFIGAFLYLTPLPLAAVLVLFVIVVAVTRAISAGSIIAAGTFPLGVWLILHPPAPVLIASLIAGALHRLPPQIEHGTIARRDRKSLYLEQKMTLAIIGAGSWGTALAIVLAPKFERVRLWVHEQDLAAAHERRRARTTFISPVSNCPTTSRSSPILGTACIAPASSSASCLRITREACTRRCCRIIDPSMIFVSATKGIENGTLLRMSEVIERGYPGGRSENRCSVRADLRPRSRPRRAGGRRCFLHQRASPRRCKPPSPVRLYVCIQIMIRLAWKSVRPLKTSSPSARESARGLVSETIHWPR